MINTSDNDNQIALFESIINFSDDAIITKTLDGIITSWNKAAEDMFGYTRDESMGKHISFIIPPDRINEELEIIAKIRAGEYVKHYETERMRKDGTTFYISLTVSPLRNREGTIVGASKIARDITSRKKDERKLRRSEMKLKELNENLIKQTRELKTSNAELEQFAYVASHDLQEPLRMVTSFLTQLDKKYSDIIDEKGKQYIFYAVDGAKRMRQIILDMLEFSKVGRTEEIIEEIDLNKLVSDILILFRNHIEKTGAVITYAGLPVISRCIAPIRQVFQNLISNALKYQKKGAIPAIDISYEETDEYWQFAVKDNGIGIDAEYFDTVFLIFQRLHNKDDYAGTGMGLAIAKKIVENMGGTIWAESEEGKGSTFYFTILKG